jgi:hypothetical protein
MTLNSQRSPPPPGRQKSFFLVTRQAEADLPQIKSGLHWPWQQAKEKRMALAGNPLTF